MCVVEGIVGQYMYVVIGGCEQYFVCMWVIVFYGYVYFQGGLVVQLFGYFGCEGLVNVLNYCNVCGKFCWQFVEYGSQCGGLIGRGVDGY